jgi:hypothetical protein
VSQSLALVIADTSQHVLARNALLHTVRALDFSQVLIYSDRPEAWPGLSVRHIAPLASLAAYNRLIVHRLAEDLQAEHALVIQYDGFVLNPDQYSPHFRHYDYIGAPWPQCDSMDVGNGGFSWRSQRLVEAAARLPYDGEQQAEDLHICRDLRPLLETRGMRFAPRAIAAHFATETVPVPWPTFCLMVCFTCRRCTADRSTTCSSTCRLNAAALAAATAASVWSHFGGSPARRRRLAGTTVLA